LKEPHQFCPSTILRIRNTDTIKEIVRDAPFGQLLRYATRNRVLNYPEELPGFQVPSAYFQKGTNSPSLQNIGSTTAIRHPTHERPPDPLSADLEKLPSLTAEVEKHNPRYSTSTAGDDVEIARIVTVDRIHTLPFTQERLEADRQAAELALHGTKSESRAVVPT
jgi:DHA1 family multidrug resistance protein-like MFS transporter